MSTTTLWACDVEGEVVEHHVVAERLADPAHGQQRALEGRRVPQARVAQGSRAHRSAPPPASELCAPTQPERRASTSVNRVSGMVSATNSTPATTYGVKLA